MLLFLFIRSEIGLTWLKHFSFQGHSEVDHLVPSVFISNHYVQHDNFISLNEEPALDFLFLVGLENMFWGLQGPSFNNQATTSNVYSAYIQ